MKKLFSVLAMAALVAACGGGDEAAEGTQVGTDTSLVTTTDTVMQPIVTQDTAMVVTDTMVQADTAVVTDTVPRP